MSKKLFYLLSFTWGLLYSMVGILAAIILTIIGCKPKIYGYCLYYTLGSNWGGCNLGPVFIISHGEGEHTKRHEHGHAFQNCIFGPLTPFIISIPSAIRYQYREYLVRVKKRTYYSLPDYDSVWFEGQATKLGYSMIIE